MSLLDTVTPADDSRTRANARRAERLDVRRMLWRESSLPSVRKCGKQLAPGNSTGVALRVLVTAAGCRAGLGGLEACGSAWSCPWCSAKIATHRQGEVAKAIAEWQRRGGGLGFVTLTMRHYSWQDLSDLWDALSYAWEKVTTGRAWKDEQAVYGGPFTRTLKSGPRAGCEVTEDRIHTVRVVEVTHGANGWHVHVHALLFLTRELSDATVDEIGRRMFARWQKALVRKGLDAPLADLGGLDARAVTGATAGELLGDYLSKNVYSGAESAALEATRGDLKKARGGNRTPFAILADVFTRGDAADLELWHTWEQASRGRRGITWSVGLRDLLAVGEELTDEEVARADEGGDTALWIAPEGHGLRNFVRTPGLVAEVLGAAEQHRLDLVVAMLDDAGVSFMFPELVMDDPAAWGL